MPFTFSTDTRTPTKPITTTTPRSCSKGWYLNTTLNDCRLCPINTYKDKSGNTPCKNCPEGKITLRPGANNLSSCIDSKTDNGIDNEEPGIKISF